MKITTWIETLPKRYRSVYTRTAERDVGSFSDLVDLVRREEQAHPDARILVTLDDFDHMLYTSMHATESDELKIDTKDLDFLNDPNADAVREPRQFAYTSAQLANAALRTFWAEPRVSRESAAEAIDVLAAMNDDPTALLDDLIVVAHIPVANATTAIAAYPNGYFSVDWNVFENHAVDRYLADRVRLPNVWDRRIVARLPPRLAAEARRGCRPHR